MQPQLRCQRRYRVRSVIWEQITGPFFVYAGIRRKNMFEENVLISFLRKFDQHPFIVDYRGREYQIGEGIPVFRVKFNQNIPCPS